MGPHYPLCDCIYHATDASRLCRSLTCNFPFVLGSVTYAYTELLVERVLNEEQPNLVVFMGDQLNGQGISWDARPYFPSL